MVSVSLALAMYAVDYACPTTSTAFRAAYDHVAVYYW